MEQRLGTCRLCGTSGELTFEHVPPKRAFNDQTVLLQTIDEWERGVGGEYQVGGRGAHVLCQKCNNDTGGAYGGAFVDWCKQGFEQLHAIRDRETAIYHGVISPLRVLKQIAVMFFDTGGDGFRLKYPELVRFVLDPSRAGLPQKYRFHVFWYGGGNLRQTGVAGLASMAGGTLSVLAEVVHPPFGYLLATGGPLPDSRPRDISDFANYEDAERIHLHRRLPVLQTHTPIPGDYRTAEQLARDVRQSELAAAECQNAGVGRRGA